MNTKKIIFAVILLFLFCILFFFFLRPGINVVPVATNNDIQQSSDPVQTLKDSNSSFREGTEFARQGKNVEAIASLEQALSSVDNVKDKSVISFVISTVKFEVSREEGLKSLTELSTNEAYSERTRALAMLRAYLLQSKFNDNTLLQKLALDNDIKWTIPEEVTYQYMKKVFDLHPFALARLHMLNYELNSISEKPLAKQLYEANVGVITAGIEDHKKWSGEVMEFTSTMLRHAILLSRLALEYEAVENSEVETAFKELIDFDNARNLTTNKQFALLYYANFLAGLGELDRAEATITLILKEGVDKSFAEAMTKASMYVTYPNLIHITKRAELNTPVVDFINAIGSKLN